MEDEWASIRTRPEERAVLPLKVHPKRLLEFSLGREAARRALAKLGLNSSAPLLQGKDGEVLWPNGYIGSVTHTAGIACAAVGPLNKVRSLGIDLESLVRKLHPDLAEKICVGQERAWVNQDPALSSQRVRTIFSAKESIYKAIYPLARVYFGFKAVELTWDAKNSGFEAKLLQEISKEFEAGFGFKVGCWESQNLVLTSVLLKANSNP